MASRTFEQIRSAYEDNEQAATLLGPLGRMDDDDTLLHLAAFRGNEDDVRDLVSLGAAVNARGDFGMTALHQAAVGGHIAVAEALLALGADRALPDEFGHTAAQMAARGSHTELAALLRPSRRPHARR